MNKPTLIQRYADNGEHSHWELIDTQHGKTLWAESPSAPVEQEGQDRGEMKDANETWEEIIGYIETQQFIRTKYETVISELKKSFTTPNSKL